MQRVAALPCLVCGARATVHLWAESQMQEAA